MLIVIYLSISKKIYKSPLANRKYQLILLRFAGFRHKSTFSLPFSLILTPFSASFQSDPLLPMPATLRNKIHSLPHICPSLPYPNIMKSPAFCTQGHWSLKEKQLFVQGFHLFGRQWSKYASLLPSRDPKQVRSHAQKCLRKGLEGLEKEIETEETCCCAKPQLPCVSEMGVQCDEVDVLLEGQLGASVSFSCDALPPEVTQVSDYEGFWDCPQTYI